MLLDAENMRISPAAHNPKNRTQGDLQYRVHPMRRCAHVGLVEGRKLDQKKHGNPVSLRRNRVWRGNHCIS